MNTAQPFFDNRNVYFGDIHNHCGISYAHGSLEDALYNAALQLDFTAITGHAGWPDMADAPMPPAVTDYHTRGFKKLHNDWGTYVRTVEEHNRPGSFLTFFSYEFHSFRFGDRTIVTPLAPPKPSIPADPQEMETLLRSFNATTEHALLLPHHIGYRKGYRGLDWESVTDAASPLVEIYSMHGSAETDEDARFPYMHTMGPLHGAHTMQAGLAAGHHFGVSASTDHHSAHPGSYGYGRTAVWAEDLTRESLWQALLDRRTYALTGDRMRVTFAVEGAPLGSRITVPAGPRRIHGTVRGGAALDSLELLKNNRVIHREVFPERRESLPDAAPEREFPLSGIVYLEFGWGQKGEAVAWDITIEVTNGTLTEVEPRLRGIDVVDPLDTADRPRRFSSWQAVSGSAVHLTTMTFGNQTTTTVQTQGIALGIAATEQTQLLVTANGSNFTVPVSTIMEHSRTFYTGGFTSPAIRIHRFTADTERCATLDLTDSPDSDREDWYYLRIFQRNGHAAWTSPVWVRS